MSGFITAKPFKNLIVGRATRIKRWAMFWEGRSDIWFDIAVLPKNAGAETKSKTSGSFKRELTAAACDLRLRNKQIEYS
jgi:hypothetical protein